MLQQAVAERPDNPGAWFNYALLLQRLNRIREAEAAMRRALEFWPERGDLWLRQAELLKTMQRLPESEAALRRALALDPRLSGGYRLLAGVLADQQRLDEALQVLAAGRDTTATATRAPASCSCSTSTTRERRDAVRAAQGVRRRARAAASGALRALRPVRSDPERKLRIGFLSGDFLRAPGRLDVRAADRPPRPLALRGYCYSLFDAADDLTRYIAVRARLWHEVSTLTPRQLADAIHATASTSSST
jgi:tetratricopeptide (TPR) repeat protein